MRRPLIALLALLTLPAAVALAQTPDEMRQTAQYLARFQNPDGGFAAQPGGASSLGTTSSIMRSLKNVGGSIPDVARCLAYVKSCRDRESGGFAPRPGGTPDVGTTASGLMALGELKAADEETVKKAIEFFSKNAKSFEEIRIAVAGLEAVNAKSPDFPRWTEQVKSDRHDDGTWGQGPGKARATGGAAAALLRMGVELDKKDAVLAAMREGQRPDGGWGQEAGPSDLGSTYRVMRCFFMLKEKPDLDRLRSYLASHRSSDGGYSMKPGGPSDVGATYFATTTNRWVRLLSGEPAVVETAGFAPLFDGKSLDGWEGDTSLWSARDGMLVGKSPGIKHNDFLATNKSYRDFILKFSFRLVGGQGNSGVQFRSVRVPPHEMSGYQADIGEGFWGCLYDESRRNKVLVQASERAQKAVNKDGWNHYVLRVMGDHITLTLNGVTSVDYREKDDDIARDGKIGVQIHAGGPMEVQFKDMYIQALPDPKADNAATPGFHLRTLKSGDGRKYSVFLPTGYDGKTPFPVVLFLHGAGERGEDGVVCAQVGLGAIINQKPDAFPAIVVFPQARRTWSADSDDAKAALAALDEVMADYKVDPRRVVLTGLSMGGAGSWSNASAHPERFSAVAPVCGFGRPEMVKAVKDLPLWTFLGDADNERIVGSTRAMVAALREAGASPRETEYRGVGHNSWDRAYSDPALIEWMLAQKRKGDGK
jgi:acetyl esterase/lipase/prenyltransferase beta subunit